MLEFYNTVKFSLFLLILVISTVIIFYNCCETKPQHPLIGKTICIDPGHGGTAATDTFRVGPGGEREEWINLRVALYLQEFLQKEGIKVVMTRTTDEPVDLKSRALLAIENKADVFVSIHHNATADTSVNFPIIYFHGNASENQASVQLAKILAQSISSEMYDRQTPVSVVSDHVIFPGSGTAVLKHSYGIPGVIGEASFFSNAKEEIRLKNEDYNKKEALAYLRTLKEFFSQDHLPIAENNSTVTIELFTVFQEADRMNKIVKLWKQDFDKAKQLYETVNADSLKLSFDLFTRSIRSFPDSWLAGTAHEYRVNIFNKLGEYEKSEMEKRRVEEYYILQMKQKF